MMKDVSVQAAESASRGRAIIMTIAAVVLLVVGAGQLGNFTYWKIWWRSGAWLLTIFLWMILLAAGGGLRLRGRMRALMNDELSLQNRSRAFTAGFYVTIATALILYVTSARTGLGAQDSIRLLASVGVSAALLRYAWLEWR